MPSTDGGTISSRGSAASPVGEPKSPTSPKGLRQKASRIFKRKQVEIQPPVPSLPEPSAAWPQSPLGLQGLGTPPPRLRTPPFHLLIPQPDFGPPPHPAPAGRLPPVPGEPQSPGPKQTQTLQPIIYQPPPLRRYASSGNVRHRASPSAQSIGAIPLPVRTTRASEDHYMAVFEVALAYLLTNEGSAFVNDPADHGGPTRYGITQSVLSSYLGRPASMLDVQNIDHTTVAAIYRTRYWLPICGDKIQNQGVANALLDLAALTGPTQAARMMQAAAQVAADGLVGPKTLAAINASPSQALLVGFSHKACAYFAAIALRDPTQAKFLSGWQLRAHRMLMPVAI